MPTDTTYQGFANWETWNVNLWLQNDEGLYTAHQAHRGDWTDRTARAFLEEILPDGTPDFQTQDDPPGAGAYDRVDWDELADRWNRDRVDNLPALPTLPTAGTIRIIRDAETSSPSIVWGAGTEGVDIEIVDCNLDPTDELEDLADPHRYFATSTSSPAVCVVWAASHPDLDPDPTYGALPANPPTLPLSMREITPDDATRARLQNILNLEAQHGQYPRLYYILPGNVYATPSRDWEDGLYAEAVYSYYRPT